MCVQDLRITAGLTLRFERFTTDASGNALMPSFQNATLVWGIFDVGGFILAGRDPLGTLRVIPSSAEYQSQGASYRVYDRWALGPFLYQPVFANGGAGNDGTVYWYEMDAETVMMMNKSYHGD